MKTYRGFELGRWSREVGVGSPRRNSTPTDPGCDPGPAHAARHDWVPSAIAWVLWGRDRRGLGRCDAGPSGRVDVVWRLRRSPIVWAALVWVAGSARGCWRSSPSSRCFFVWAFGHPLAWSVIGCLFAVLPLAGLILAIGVGLRAAVIAGPGRIGVRFLGRWRVVDLGQVRVVRLADPSAHSEASVGSVSGGFGGACGSGGDRCPRPRWARRFGPRETPEEGVPGVGLSCSRTSTVGASSIGVDALDAGLAAVVREGLAPDAEIDPDAARALGRGSEPRSHREIPRRLQRNRTSPSGPNLASHGRRHATEPDAGARRRR